MTTIYQQARKALMTVTGITALVAGATGCRSTGDTEAGMVYCKWGCVGEKAEMVPAGQYKWVTPVKDQWFTLTTARQFMPMVRTFDKEGKLLEKDDLEFKTEEGNDIGQDVTLEWGIDGARVQYVVENVGTDMEDIREKIVRPLSRSILRDYFGKLNSQQFYDGNSRFDAAREGQAALNTVFKEYGLVVHNVNPGRYYFNDKYQEAINRAQNAKENKEKFIEQQKTATHEWAAKLEQQRGASNETIANAEGYENQKKNESEGEYANRVKEGDVQLAQRTAEAEGIKQRNKAMMSRGGKYAVQAAFASSWAPEEILVLPCESTSGNNVSMSVTDVNALIGGYNATKK